MYWYSKGQKSSSRFVLVAKYEVSAEHEDVSNVNIKMNFKTNIDVACATNLLGLGCHFGIVALLCFGLAKRGQQLTKKAVLGHGKPI